MREYSMTAIAVAAVLGIAGPTLAAGHYGPGVTDSEIKLGNTTPYRGPVSSVATTAKAELAYFAMVNAAGGVNRRKITFLSLDDAYSPSKTIEQTRKLGEYRRCTGYCRNAGHTDQHGDPQIPEPETGAKPAHRLGRDSIRRPEDLPVVAAVHALGGHGGAS